MSTSPDQNNKKPTLLVTGASGFIGRYFLNAVKDEFFIYAMARRSQKDSGIPVHPNIVWVLADISNESAVQRITDKIAARGGVNFVFHLAAYYDFENDDKPEYQHTNIDGTRYLLENTAKLNITRFFYSSSATVTDFSKNRIIIDESSRADASPPYPRSKAVGEGLVNQFSQKFPCTIIRLGAVYSDWCEFGPLYMLLYTWLSSNWRSKILAGKGATAIPYLHIIDLINLFLCLIHRQANLSNFDIFLASTNGYVTHRELFELATRYNFGQSYTPRLLPRILAYCGLWLTYAVGIIRGKPVFERPWMAKYIDLQMNVDASRTQQAIGWKPIPRYHITRRLLYLVENKKSNPFTWRRVNKVFLDRKDNERPNVRIHEALLALKEEAINENVGFVQSSENALLFPRYCKLPAPELRKRIAYYYYMLEIAIHYGDRMQILASIPNMGRARYLEGFELPEITAMVQYLGRYVVNRLCQQQGLFGIRQRIESEIMITVQIINDEMEDVFHRLIANHPCNECRQAGISLCTHETALLAVFQN